MGEHRASFKPGGQVLYDGRSDSYVLVFRDGYNIGGNGQWVVNKEATLRIVKGSGELAEFNYDEHDPLESPPLTATDEQLEYAVRNYHETPLPPNAQVLIDLANKRLVLARPTELAYGPAQYGLPQAVRAYWEIDVYLLPAKELIWTSRVDTEKAEVLDQLYYLPMSQREEITRMR
jgi:hypothetical protein